MGRSRDLAVAGALGALVLSATALLIANGRRAPRLDPPPPVPRVDVLPSEAPPSTLSIPLALPLSVLVDLLEEAVPRTSGTPDSLRPLPDRGRAAVAVALERGPFGAVFVDDVAVLATMLRYRLRVSYDLPALPDPRGSCGFDGSGSPGLVVTLRSPVSLASNWRLQTDVEVVEVRPATDDASDRCEVTLLGLDVTEQVVQGARSFIEEHLAEIDRRASDIDTRSRFEEWWRVLQEPIAIGDSLWLSIGPQSIRRGPVRGTRDSLHVALALSARPRVHLGRRPTLPRFELPPLDSGIIEPRLDLLVDGRADYAAGSGILQQRLAGTAIDLGGRALRLDSLRIYGVGGGRLALEVRVSGDLRGTLFLTGTPVVDAESSSVSVPDLDFDVATEREVFGIVPALAALSLRDFLRAQASWPIDPALRFLTDWLGRGLNRSLSSDLRVTGTVDTVAIAAVYPLREVLVVRMVARGFASLVIVE